MAPSTSAAHGAHEGARSRVTYEDLEELEREFDDVELEILRQQTRLQAPLYEKRAKLIEDIPNFWPLVLEQAPQEIDQYIQPTDSNALVHLRSIDVKRFEVAPYAVSSSSSRGDGASAGDAASGNPRSVAITFTFSPNEWFADAVLEKKFWFRQRVTRVLPDGTMDDGWSGLVSEPVRIRWKSKAKDLTEGLNAAAYAAWQAEQQHAATAKTQDADGASSADGSGGKRVWLPEHEALKKLMQRSTEGALSFFTWFSYRGPNIVAEEDRLAMLEQEARSGENGRAEKRNGGQENGGDGSNAGPGDGAGDAAFDTEVFPSGEDLAIAISDDLFPCAVTYFIQGQEEDLNRDSDDEFEEDVDDSAEEESVDNEEIANILQQDMDVELDELIPSSILGEDGDGDDRQEVEEEEEEEAGRPKKKKRT